MLISVAGSTPSSELIASRSATDQAARPASFACSHWRDRPSRSAIAAGDVPRAAANTLTLSPTCSCNAI